MPAQFQPTSKEQLLKPALKWAGGKRWLVPHLIPIWSQYTRCRLVEPFCGGLAVALGLNPKRALINDINPHLMNFYTQLKKGLTISISMRNDESLYYQYRERFNELIRNGQAATSEGAQLFYFLNRTGFNGLCRFNRKGEFNVPFGSYKAINYIKDFSKYRYAFAEWEFSNKDFADLELTKDDFVYADPPYDVEFTQYSQGGFSWDDQVRLVEFLADHPGPVLLSNQATKRIVKLYKEAGLEIRLLKGPRRISCTGNRTPAREVLAFKNVKGSVTS